MRHFKLKIEQVTRTRPQDEAWGTWERENRKFSNIDDLREYIIDVYGKIPFLKGNEVYRDTKEGVEHIGYHYSFWEYSCDRSLPPDHKYFATDWITIYEVKEVPAVDRIQTLTKKAG